MLYECMYYCKQEYAQEQNNETSSMGDGKRTCSKFPEAHYRSQRTDFRDVNWTAQCCQPM